MVKRSGLGKGLEALLDGVQLADEFSFNQGETKVEKSDRSKEVFVKWLFTSQLRCSPHQPRKDFSEKSLNELAESIRSQGFVQPIVARKVADEQYEIVAGERRWRASKLLSLEKIPVIIRELTDSQVMTMALIENVQREDLNIIEEALALHRIQQEMTLTHQQMADMLGKSRSSISNTLRLLALSIPIRDRLANHLLEMGHARALLALPENKREEVAVLIEKKQLSVRQTELLVKQLLQPIEYKKETKVKEQKDQYLKNLERTLSDRMNCAIDIDFSNKTESGSVNISFSSLEDLENILSTVFNYEYTE